MELRPITMEDLPLYEQLLTDPVMMSELGGPRPREGLREKLQGIVDDVEADRTWFFVIVPEPETGVAVGHVCVWEHDAEGTLINEIGWMVVPERQGQGIGKAAVGDVLDRARDERRWGLIRAYPGITNAPSNGICRTLGFTNFGEIDITYEGRTLRCNDWRIDVLSDPMPND